MATMRFVKRVAFVTVVVVIAVGCSSGGRGKHTSGSLQITTTVLPDATEGIAYSYTVTASGGNAANYTWSISGQPSWLAIDAATGELSGTPPTGSAGTYTFTVEVTNGQQTARKQFDLVVRQAVPPAADFEGAPTYGTAPLTVTFTDKSTGTITQWEWDFDNDGTVDSSDQNPTYIYNDAGWYTVKLTVSGPAGSDTCVKEKCIQVAGNIYYVDGVNGNDANGGTGWNDAFATIGKALSVAGDYDLVLVADATYNETDLNFNGKKVYLKGVDHNTSGAQPVIDCQGKGRAFYFGSGETGNSVIDNFTIKNGSADYGGAINCRRGSPTLTNCTFNGNSSDWDGGAIRCHDPSSPTVTNCTFISNSASGTYAVGGAICCGGKCKPKITDCTFTNNSARMHGGAIYCTSYSNPKITNCTFSGNSATGAGGAIYCCGDDSPSITNCTFSGNNANNGGAIGCASHGNPSITNCAFSGNSASGGGAVYCDLSEPSITNCTFIGNSADNGGAIDCNNFAGPTLTNCTLSGNSASHFGGAIYCTSGVPTLSNCILWGNTASSDGNEIYISDTGSFCALNYCCVDKTGYGFESGVPTTTIDDSNNCIFVDPQFVDPANGDYHLKDTSPCIDAGNNRLVPSSVDTELDGEQRIVDGDNDGTATVDIGAYEHQP